MKLTERDKKLLLMLAYFVVIVGFGALVFKPLIQYYMNMGDEIVLLEAQKEEMDARIAEEPGLEQRRNELADLYRISTQDYYPMLESQEVDKEITGIVLSSGMQALNLNIVMPQEGIAVTMYPYAEKETGSVLPDDASESLSPDEAGTEAEETFSQSFIYAPLVTLTACGSEAQVESLIDRLTRDYPAIRLRGYSRQKQAADWVEESVAGMEFVSLELELYMCDRSVLEQGENP